MVMAMKTMEKLIVENDIKYLCDEMIEEIDQVLSEFVKKQSLKDQIIYCMKDIIKYYCNEIVMYVFNLISDIEEGRI